MRASFRACGSSRPGLTASWNSDQMGAVASSNVRFTSNSNFRSYNLEQWKTHTMWHFRGQDPPRLVECPLCETFNYTYPNGFEVWDARMNHQAQHHYVGHALATARPEFKLHHYLWQRRIIYHAELQELKGAPRLQHAPADA
ncbi:hypothetical protein H2201_009263, partial [Coniosporium apollinis]